MTDAWRINPYGHSDKTIQIDGPGVTIQVDYDDVDHEDVDRRVENMLATLNGVDCCGGDCSACGEVQQ